MTRVALYARYSSENQREASIDDQFRNCENYAKRQDGWTITRKYEDKAISGSVAARPAYQEMLKDAKARVFDVLLIDDFSRLSRDQVETEQVRRRFVHWGVRLIGISDGIDTSSKGHKMLSSFKGIMNEVFLDDLREKTRRGMVGQVLKGYHGGGRSYGYRLTPEYDPINKDPYGQQARIGSRLEIDPEQAVWVKWIFERYASGWCPRKIVDTLNKDGVPPPGVHYKRRAGKPPTWCASALFGNPRYQLGLLNNARYQGQVNWGRAVWQRDPDSGKKRRLAVDEAEWTSLPAPHLKIIDDALWAAVKQRQATIHANSAAIRTALSLSPTMSTGRGPRYLFSSILICAQCQHKFIVVDPQHYGCSGWKYRGLSVCNNTIKVRRSIVESVLLEAIQRDLFTEEGYLVFKQEVARLLAERRRTPIPNREGLHLRLAEVEGEIANMMTAIKAGILTPTTKAELEKVEAEKERLLSQLQPRQGHADNVTTMLPNLKKRFETLVGNMGAIPKHHIAHAREALKSLVGNTIALHPCADGTERYLTAEVTGDYAGLLRLATGKINVVEGRGVEPPTPTLRT